MKKSPWKRLLSALWVIGGTFLVVEVLLRAISGFVPVYDLEMVDYARELKVHSPIPGVTHQHRANATATLMNVEVALNSLGHRSPELSATKGPNTRRIHFIGSSILLGWGVPEDKGLVAVTQKLMNEHMTPITGHTYEVINAGIGNYNTFYEVELFERQVDKTKPDLVVLQYYINDAEPNPTGGDNPFITYSRTIALLYLRLKSLASTGARSLVDHYRALYHDGQPDWERTKKSFRKLKALCDRRGIPVVVLLVPEIHDFTQPGPYADIYAMLQKTLDRMGIPLINPRPAIVKRFAGHPSDAWIARDDPHPSAEVHEILAKALYRYLSSSAGRKRFD